MKKFLLLLSAAALLFASCASTPDKAEKAASDQDKVYNLVVLHTNDHHGHPLAFYNYPAGDQAGLPARATLVKQVRSNNPNVLLLDAGDFNTGRPESNFFNAEADIIGYNYMSYDAVAVGNHEFDNPMDIMQKQIEWSEFPWLCANVKKGGEYLPNVKPYVVKDMGDFKVGILGLLSEKTKETGNPDHIGDLDIMDPVEVAKTLVPEIQKEADVVIALVHMGLYPEESEGSKRLAKEVPGLALIVDGHTHTKPSESVRIANPDGYEVPIVQAYQWGLQLGYVDMSFKKDGSIVSVSTDGLPVNVMAREKLDDGSSRYFAVDNAGNEINRLEEDAGLLAKLQPFADKVDKVMSQKIGTATDVFDNTNSRKQETAIGNFVSEAMLWFTKDMDPDFALQNGGGIRETLGAGEITKGDVNTVLPFDNSVVVLTMKGEDLKEVFKHIGTTVGHGSFAQTAGISYTLNAATQEVSDIMINGEAFDPSKTYKVVTNSYMAAGGDGYSGLTKAINFYDTSLFQRDAFIAYVEHLGGSITPEVKGNINLITE